MRYVVLGLIIGNGVLVVLNAIFGEFIMAALNVMAIYLLLLTNKGVAER